MESNTSIKSKCSASAKALGLGYSSCTLHALKSLCGSAEYRLGVFECYSSSKVARELSHAIVKNSGNWTTDVAPQVSAVGRCCTDLNILAGSLGRLKSGGSPTAGSCACGCSASGSALSDARGRMCRFVWREVCHSCMELRARQQFIRDDSARPRGMIIPGPGSRKIPAHPPFQPRP